MRSCAMSRLVVLLVLNAFFVAARAASADDFDMAYAKAETASQKAHALKNEWIARIDGHKWTTAEGLKTAKAAAADGNFDEAIKIAQKVEVFANDEIEQAEEQAKVWPQAMIH